MFENIVVIGAGLLAMGLVVEEWVRVVRRGR